ncbi:hypothetical protein [Deinococcus multiflagellatus]|uniref:Uncharacterized protein n=1 Tax=Deinococcus multiflagellatus TaxID=1656887 RepID=A0ABW1ZHZ4_9DEIO
MERGRQRHSARLRPGGAEAQLSLGRALGWGRWSARYAYQQTATAQHANHELSVSLATDAARTLQTVLVGYGPVWRWTYSGRASLSGAGAPGPPAWTSRRWRARRCNWGRLWPGACRCKRGWA